MLLSCLIILLAAGLVNFYFSVQILRKVSDEEFKSSFFEIRWQVHKNLRKYCQLTRAERGRVGFDFYGYWLTLFAMLVCVMAIFALAVKS